MPGLEIFTLETALLATVGLLGLMVATQIAWLVGRRYRERSKTRRLARLDRVYSDLLLDVLDEDGEGGGQVDAVAALRAVPRRDLRDWLTAIAARTSGDYLDRIRELYAELGLADRDLRSFRRSGRLVQLVAARRLTLMGPTALVAGSVGVDPKSHGARLLRLMAMGTDAPAELLVGELRNWPAVDELQGHPLRKVLRGLGPEQHALLMSRWSQIEEPSVQALVLREACLQLPERQAAWLRSAFESPHAALRAAACDICREMGRVDQAVRVMNAAEDSSPAVREASVTALASLGIESARDPLIHALQDPIFEVQLAAAHALFRLGGKSLQQLQWARRHHPDGRCRDVCAMVLDELDAEAA
jgi:hypothetical protein